MNGTKDEAEPEEPAHGRRVQKVQAHGHRPEQDTDRRRIEPKAPFTDTGETRIGYSGR